MESAQYTLPSGLKCHVVVPKLPLVRDYFVVHAGRDVEARLTESHVEELWALAHRLGRRAAADTFGDRGCVSLLYNGERTRRMPWDHVHVILARNTVGKRWTLFWLAMKRFTRIASPRRAGGELSLTPRDPQLGPQQVSISESQT